MRISVNRCFFTGSVASFVVEHPYAMWLVGPFFAAFTGLAFNEGA